MRRTSAGILGALLLTASLAQADETKCLEAVRKLAAAVRDESTSWQDRWDAYKAAKDALKDGDEACEAAYVAIRADVEKGLRRESFPVMGWIMGFFGASLLWGGFMVCVAIAMKRRQIEETAEHGDEV